MSNGFQSPRFKSPAVRACRVYRLIMLCDLWPVRSATHVSVLPLASAVVTNPARRSCARRNWRQRSSEGQRLFNLRINASRVGESRW